eukprot:4824337-Pyramimonas_sp.AAC.1
MTPSWPSLRDQGATCRRRAESPCLRCPRLGIPPHPSSSSTSLVFALLLTHTPLPSILNAQWVWES